ncbi:MAG: type II secretion system minor pseudopilin GspK [Deltaproteobacteria bacterium]|nr:type II secretion system minor pseudopilin GspK [Deltaproteobacteria bacterium]
MPQRSCPKLSKKNPLRLVFSSEGGLALITTLLITAILVTIVSEFAYRVYVSTARAGNIRDSARAALLAEDGVTLGKSGLEKLLKKRPYLTMDESGLTFSQTISDDMGVAIKIEDERSKASLRVVYTATGLSNDNVEGIYIRLLKALNLDERLKDTLADWIDDDGDPRHYGAETPDYQSLKTPYKPRNNNPESLEELLMIKGYTKEAFRIISPFVSPYNTDGLININTAPKPVLMALSEDMTEELAKRIMAYRKETPFRSKSEIMKVRGFETAGYSIQDKITVESQIYRITVKAKAGDAIRLSEAVVKTGGGVLYWREM